MKLINVSNNETHPSWSSNGKIAFDSDRENNVDIWVMDADRPYTVIWMESWAKVKLQIAQ